MAPPRTLITAIAVLGAATTMLTRVTPAAACDFNTCPIVAGAEPRVISAAAGPVQVTLRVENASVVNGVVLEPGNVDLRYTPSGPDVVVVTIPRGTAVGSYYFVVVSPDGTSETDGSEQLRVVAQMPTDDPAPSTPEALAPAPSVTPLPTLTPAPPTPATTPAPPPTSTDTTATPLSMGANVTVVEPGPAAFAVMGTGGAALLSYGLLLLRRRRRARRANMPPDPGEPPAEDEIDRRLEGL